MIGLFTAVALQVALDLGPELAQLDCPTQEQWLSGDGRASKDRADATRERVAVACKALGATAEACKVLDAVTVRESSGDPCAIHTLGPGEYGVGPHGLSWRWHRFKWYTRDAEALDPHAFHVPEVSTVVAIRLFRQAVTRYRASTWMDVNDVFAGRLGADELDNSRRARFCRRLRDWEIDCKSDPRKQLGTKLGTGPSDDQAEFVAGLLETPQ